MLQLQSYFTNSYTCEPDDACAISQKFAPSHRIGLRSHSANVTCENNTTLRHDLSHLQQRWPSATATLPPDLRLYSVQRHCHLFPSHMARKRLFCLTIYSHSIHRRSSGYSRHVMVSAVFFYMSTRLSGIGQHRGRQSNWEVLVDNAVKKLLTGRHSVDFTKSAFEEPVGNLETVASEPALGLDIARLATHVYRRRNQICHSSCVHFVARGGWSGLARQSYRNLDPLHDILPDGLIRHEWRRIIT